MNHLTYGEQQNSACETPDFRNAPALKNPNRQHWKFKEEEIRVDEMGRSGFNTGETRAKELTALNCLVFSRPLAGLHQIWQKEKVPVPR